jgi:hypothetical protein
MRCASKSPFIHIRTDNSLIPYTSVRCDQIAVIDWPSSHKPLVLVRLIGQDPADTLHVTDPPSIARLKKLCGFDLANLRSVEAVTAEK